MPQNNRKKRRKAVSTIISSALLIAVSAGAITSIVLMTSPIAEDLGHTRTIRTMFERMPLLGQQIEAVSNLENGTTQQVGIGFRNGRLRVESAPDTVEFLIDTSSEIVSPRSSRKFGNVRISAGAEVTVNETVYEGKKAYIIQNDHIAYYLKRIPESTEELLGYWELDEGTGQTTTNYHNTTTGVLGTSRTEDSSDPEWTYDCQSGSCLSFDGEDDYVFIENISESLNKPPYTYSAWIKPEGSTGENQYIISNSAQSESEGATFSYEESSGDLEFMVQSDSLSGETATGLDFNEWTHILGTWDGTDETGSIKLYINGELESEGTPSESTSDDQEEGLSIGTADNTLGNYVFNGRIDELALYNHTMEPSEIDARYKSYNFVNSFVSTEDILLGYNNTDTGHVLENISLNAYVNENRESMKGFGYTEAEEIGRHLPSGDLRVIIDSMTGISYRVEFQLLSGSDFFTVYLDDE